MDPQRVPERIAVVLRAISVSGSLCSEAELGAPWGIVFPEFPGHTMFHLVLEGRMWLEVEGTGRWVERGEFALVTHGNGHIAASHPGAPTVGLFDTQRRYLNDRYEILRHGGDGPRTRTLCGVSSLGSAVARRFVRSLPSVIHMPSASEATRFLVDLVFEESREERTGSLEVVTKLTDVLILKTVQSYVDGHDLPFTGWLGALADDRVGGALAAIHERPKERWTVAKLAELAGMSRSGFSNHFTKIVGEPAVSYLTRWRMETASERLAGSNETLEAIAHDLGYDSAAAFSHAFKRFLGVSPGAYRKGAPVIL